MRTLHTFQQTQRVVKAKTCQTSETLLTARTLITAYFRNSLSSFPNNYLSPSLSSYLPL
ncbi:hypothetical protein GBAR_LOCUS9257, partial [Geodia barretti]